MIRIRKIMCVSDKIVENGTLVPTYKCLRPQLRRCFGVYRHDETLKSLRHLDRLVQQSLAELIWTYSTLAQRVCTTLWVDSITIFRLTGIEILIVQIKHQFSLHDGSSSMVRQHTHIAWYCDAECGRITLSAEANKGYRIYPMLKNYSSHS